MSNRESFCALLERCGLLNQQQLDGIRNYFERNAGEAAERLLAEQLIQRGLLTPWQLTVRRC